MKFQTLCLSVLALMSIAIGGWFGWHADADLHKGQAQDTMVSDAAEEQSIHIAAPVSLKRAPENTKPAVADTSQQDIEEEEVAYALDPAAIASMQAAREQGDPRSPSLSESIDRSLPTAAELSDYDAYANYEQRQSKEVYRAYVLSAEHKATYLRDMIAMAKKDGLPPEQIQEGEEKLRRIEAMRAELLAEHPDLLNGAATPAVTSP